MPTYKNISDKPILIHGLGVAPGEEISTYKILKHPNLSKISEDPIFPLALSETEVTASSAGEEIAVPIDYERCNKIEVTDITTKIELRANVDSSSNPYARTVKPGDKVIIRHNKEIETLYIRFPDSPGSCRVIQLEE